MLFPSLVISLLSPGKSKVPRLAERSVSNSVFYVLICGGVSEYLGSQSGSEESCASLPKSQDKASRALGERRREEQRAQPPASPFVTCHISTENSPLESTRWPGLSTWGQLYTGLVGGRVETTLVPAVP